MNPYDKLENEQRAWSVKETADFLGYSVSHLRRLIREGKIEGWMQVEGGDYKFCPAKLKAWMEKHFKQKGEKNTGEVDNGTAEASGKKDHKREGYSVAPELET